VNHDERNFGVYHRRVRIVTDFRHASADVEDDEHRFGADITHDGTLVTSVAGRALRTPWSSCPLAASQLEQLLETPLSASPYRVLRQTRLAQQCTHMIDMAALAVAAAARGILWRQYDAVLAVVDRDGVDCRQGTLRRDDGLRIDWVVEDGFVREPKAYAALEMRRSGRWAEQHALDADEVEAIFVMQRAMLVAGGKRFILDQHETAASQVWMTGACFAFQESRIRESKRCYGSSVRFATSDELLADLDSQRIMPE
jgi:hypothetical protein